MKVWKIYKKSWLHPQGTLIPHGVTTMNKTWQHVQIQRELPVLLLRDQVQAASNYFQDLVFNLSVDWKIFAGHMGVSLCPPGLSCHFTTICVLDIARHECHCFQPQILSAWYCAVMQSQSASWFDLCIASQFAPGGLRVQFCKQLCKWEKSSPPLLTDLSPSLLASCILRAWGSATHPGKIVWKWWAFPNFTWPQRQCLISLCYSESRWRTGKETRHLLKTQLLLLSLDFPGQYISKFFPPIERRENLTLPHSLLNLAPAR